MDRCLKESLASELNVAPEELASDKPLEELSNWDSVMVLSVMVLLSDALGTEIEPAEMVRLQTFGDIEALVASKAA